MPKWEIAALLTAAVLSWSVGGSGRFISLSQATLSSPPGLELAQGRDTGRGYLTNGPMGGARSGPVIIYGGSGQPGQGSAACSGKSAGDRCSFRGINGEPATGTCVDMHNQRLCVVVGRGAGGYGSSQNRPQQKGAR